MNESEGSCGGDATMLVEAIAALADVVAAEDAVIVTTIPDGTVAGAVYVICPPFTV